MFAVSVRCSPLTVMALPEFVIHAFHPADLAEYQRLDELTWTGNTFTIAIANAAPGATNHLESAADLVTPVWTNLYTWTGRAPATNWSGTLGTQGYFRVRIER